MSTLILGAATDLAQTMEHFFPLRQEMAAMSEPAACRRQVEGESNGEPARNRTENQQIKSLLLCQLSYGPT